MKSWLQDNNLEMRSTHNKGKLVVAEIFITTSKNKIHKYMHYLSHDSEYNMVNIFQISQIFPN